MTKQEPANHDARINTPEQAPRAAAASSLGRQIRQGRKGRELTLRAVAAKTGLSISYLSQIERDLMTPSLSTLKNIADVLGIPAGQLMFERTSDDVRGAGISVVRRGGRKRLSFPNSRIEYELLTPDLRRRASLLWLSAPPGSESGPPFSHEGEDGVIILDGQLEVEIGGVWNLLYAGDSIYFSASLPHRWRNSGAETTEAIWLSTPPSF